MIALSIAAPATAQTVAGEAEWSTSWSVTLAEKRIFPDQGFTLTEEPTLQGAATACRDDTCFGLWQAWSLVGREGDQETDFTVAHNFESGETTIQAMAGYYLVPGKEVYDFVVDASRPVSEHCLAGIRAEVMLGGFEDRVVRGYASCTFSPLVKAQPFPPQKSPDVSGACHGRSF